MFSVSSKFSQALLVIVVFIAVTGAWELLVWSTDIPAYVLPPPSIIADQLVRLIHSSIFWNNYRTTLYEVVLGYGLAVLLAVVLGGAISQIRILEKSLMPYVVAFQTIPSVALAPIFLQWFGYGISSKIVMASLISFFPILINVIAGLQSSGSDEIQMLKSFGASRLQILLKVRVPNSLPFVFAGLELGVVFALVGAIVAEFVGAQKGLGKMILQFNEQFNIAGMFAVLVVLAATGMLMHAVIKYIKRRVVFWSESN